MNIDTTDKQKNCDFLQYVLPCIGEAVIVTDLCAKVLYMNCIAEKLTGYPKSVAFGRTINETFKMFIKYAGKLAKICEEVKNGEIFRFDDCTSLITATGKKLSISGSISPIKNMATEIIGFVIIIYDKTEQKQLEKQIYYASMHDSLTGVCNRTWYEYKSLHKNESSDYPIGLIVCDIDGLKIINDTMGHKAGDHALITIAKILKECFREGDRVARIGGDEFIILLLRSSVQLVREVCKRIKQKICNYNEINSTLPLSVSIGFSVSKNSSTSITSLFQKSDDNMYKEKLHHNRSVRGAIVNTLMCMVKARDFITEGHCERLKGMVELVAFSLDLSENKINDLQLFAEFHDIGKVGIPDEILLKPASLTPDEREEMQRHCEIGNHIAMSSPDLLHIAKWILNHHEWWNGDGYPQGLKGDSIPIECRILSIIDAYDAMTNDRPYRKAMSQQEAFLELKEGSGTQFDPVLVFEFIRILGSLKIYAASSMKDAMLNIEQSYIRDNPHMSLLFRFGSSGALQKKIEKGALADIFISAASVQMDNLQIKDLIINNSREDLLHNRIVLITSKKSNIKCDFKGLADEKIRKIAIGNPDTVPAGKYAQEVLITLGILESVKFKLIFAKDVRQVLNYVETGSIDVGIVYQTDAKISDKIKILDLAHYKCHSPIIYPIAILKATENKTESKKFIKFLTTNYKSEELFEKYGFSFPIKIRSVTGKYATHNLSALMLKK